MVSSCKITKCALSKQTSKEKYSHYKMVNGRIVRNDRANQDGSPQVDIINPAAPWLPSGASDGIMGAPKGLK